MRIVHVTDCYLPRLGGIELQVHDLVRHQAALGHEVTILTTTAADPAGVGQEPVEVIRVTRPGAPPERIGYRASFAAAAGLRSGLAEYDLVHAHASTFSPLAILAAVNAPKRGVPTAVTVHSMWARSIAYYRVAHWLYRWADLPVAWSAVSNPAAAPMRRVIGDRAPVEILPNGVDPQRWRVAHQPGDGGVVRIVVVARLARRKRIGHLLAMVREVSAGLPPGRRLEVEILGDGPERPAIERYIVQHAMASWVKLRGRCDRHQIRDAFARSDLFVSPATLESFGIAALEARCAGLPVLARSGTGAEDFIEHGREGWLVGSDRDMVAMIGALARSPELLRLVGRHNRATPPSIDWDRVGSACEDLYRRAAHLQGRPWSTPIAGPTPAERAG